MAYKFQSKSISERKLVAEGSISPRRASILAYLSSLLLRTLLAIDDNARFGDDDDEAEGTNEEVEDNDEEAEDETSRTVRKSSGGASSRNGQRIR